MGVWWYVCLSRGALVGHTVTRYQSLRDDLRAPDDSARSGLKEVLLAHMGVQAEGIILLSGMLWTGPCVDHAQAMEARGHPDGPDPHPWVDSLGIECDEADRLGEYQARIWLGLAGLCGHRGTAEEPECPAQQQEEPTPSSLHMAHSVSCGIVRASPLLRSYARLMPMMKDPVSRASPSVMVSTLG
jgi:hypothetical protein